MLNDTVRVWFCFTDFVYFNNKDSLYNIFNYTTVVIILLQLKHKCELVKNIKYR